MKGKLQTLNSRHDFILPLSDTMIALLQKLKELEKIKSADLKECVFGGIGDQPLNDFLRRTAGITKHGLPLLSQRSCIGVSDTCPHILVETKHTLKTTKKYKNLLMMVCFWLSYKT